jgi:hypothetical protein
MTAQALRAPPAPALPLGLATLAKLAFDGKDLLPLQQALIARALGAPHDAAALMDLSTIAQVMGRRHERLVMQAHALEASRLYRQLPAIESANGLRLLAFMVPGDFLANTPVEFMLVDSDVTLDIVYVLPGEPLPSPLPEHDVALVAVTELEDNRPALAELAELIPTWPRPVLNAPERIVRLTRDGCWSLLNTLPGVDFPENVRIERAVLARVAAGDVAIESALVGNGFPVLLRPVDSHAGEGLVKIDAADEIDGYLAERGEDHFFLAPFVDYRGPDGLFRKYRIALIAGRPYAVHMGVSAHWMIHYLNAGMTESEEKRDEEARWMAEFDTDFAVRHAAALAAIAERIGLDYVTLDCGEMPDGRLLLFEAGNGMIVHAMDPDWLFPYKRPQMDKVFAAFIAMLRAAAEQAAILRDVACGGSSG